MLETTETARLCLELASLAVALFTLTILYLLFRWLLKTPLSYVPPPAVLPPAPAPASAAGLVAARKAAVAAKPGISCGHCGLRLKGDPIRGVAFADVNYLVFACPECQKETLLPK